MGRDLRNRHIDFYEAISKDVSLVTTYSHTPILPYSHTCSFAISGPIYYIWTGYRIHPRKACRCPA